MVIGYRKQFIDPGRHPSAAGNVIAARAVAVPAGVVSLFQVPAIIADLPVGAELPAPAMLNIVHDLVLPGMQPVCISEGRAEFPEDIADRGAIIRFVGKRLM
jgi:hypothetical protein